MKQIVFLIAVCLLLSACTAVSQERSFDNFDHEITVEGKTYQVRVANEMRERRQGLMNVEQLESNQGMLFIFDQKKAHAFWMKNTLIPLRIMWLSDDYEILEETILQPCTLSDCRTYVPKVETKYVLETAAQ